MEENNNETKKLTYEQLENVAHQLSMQVKALTERNAQLEEALKKSDFSNVYAQLQLQMEIVKNREFYPDDFVEAVILNIEEIMLPKEEKEETQKQGDEQESE